MKQKAWSKSILNPAKEFSSTKLITLKGKIPEGLRGSLYQNTGGRLQRSGMSVGHWFDADGAILVIHFNDNEARGIYRYVKTRGYLEEQKAGKYLYGNYGMVAPGAIWNRWLRPVKNVANTSVFALSDQLLALWEAGLPHSLDLETLETIGTNNLETLKENQSYSAHPKQDPETKEIFNFGININFNFTLKIELNLYKSLPTGKIVKSSSFLLNSLPLIHDFIFAGQYLIFLISPARVNLKPLILGRSCYCDSIDWKPEIGNKILVFDRETLMLVSYGETEAWFQWHFGNGYVNKDGNVVFDLVKYKNFYNINQNLKEIPTGQTKTLAKGTYWQICLQPKEAKVIESNLLMDRSCETPKINPKNIGKFTNYTYLIAHKDTTDIATERHNTLIRYDLTRFTKTEVNLPDNIYPSEPIFAEDSIIKNKNWILTVIYNGNLNSSELWIYDEDCFIDPICKLSLPTVIPIGFHGTWKTA